MGFSLSPSVDVTEIDLTLTVPSVATSIGAMAGAFDWGPVLERTLVDSETNLVKKFGKPNDSNFKDFFTASNFLSYTNNLKLVRVVDESTALNSGDTAGILIKNQDDYDMNLNNINISGNAFVAKYPGVIGNGLVVSVADATAFAAWTYKDSFDFAPTGEEFHVVVLLDGAIVEKFNVSRLTTAKDFKGDNNYAPEVINRQSNYIYIVASNIIVQTTPPVYDSISGDFTLVDGTSGTAPVDADYIAGLALFANAEEVDVNLVMQAGGSQIVGEYAVENVAKVRKDCVAFVSPDSTDVVGVAAPEVSIVAQRNNYGSCSYGVMDGNYKYQYDRYNDLFRWVPLNGDVAGLTGRTDDLADPWFSPAGLNRGQIKNVVKLAFNPSKAQRDELFKNAINPIVTFPGEGTVLFGDKTLLARPSVFTFLSVRRLFIVLEKSISTAAKFMLFGQNDAFSRNQFKALVEPFLRNVQGRRGINDFFTVVDETNNTPDQVDLGNFVADIYIRPTVSIRNIQLNFVAVSGSVSFEEIIG